MRPPCSLLLATAAATAAVAAAACSSSRPPPSAPPPQPTVVEWEVHGQEGEPGGPPGDPGADPNAPPAGAGAGAPGAAPAPVAAAKRTLPQPPEVKLKLGHFTDAKHNIGLVIDRTNKEARVRFDHMPQVLRLDPMRAPGRIDYIRTINQVVLQVHDSGRVVVFVPNASESIEVVRDGDADPL
jgi:hypothetical protein